MTDLERFKRRYLDLVSGKMIYLGIGMEDLARATNVSVSTAYRKHNKPWLWSVGDIVHMAKLFEMNPNEMFLMLGEKQ